MYEIFSNGSGVVFRPFIGDNEERKGITVATGGEGGRCGGNNSSIDGGGGGNVSWDS